MTAMAEKPETSFTIFTDASFDPRTKIAVGGAFAVESGADFNEILRQPIAAMTMSFEDTSIARAELRTALWAINAQLARFPETKSVILYSDCKMICGLPERKPRLLARSFRNSSGRILALADLYESFFQLGERVVLQIRWIKGHSPSAGRDPVHEIFSQVDKLVRKAMRGDRAN